MSFLVGISKKKRLGRKQKKKKLFPKDDQNEETYITLQDVQKKETLKFLFFFERLACRKKNLPMRAGRATRLLLTRRFSFGPTVRETLDHDVGSKARVKGWVKSVRKQKHVWFLQVNDGKMSFSPLSLLLC